MGNLGELPPYEDVSPHEVPDAAGFIASMQRLKERSGLTYRELEERAARSGDVLARSTLADVLRRTSLPRPEVLAAFVRACGDGERVDAWLATRDRLAAARTIAAPVQARDVETDAQPQTEAAAIARPRRPKGSTVAGATTLAVPMLALVAWGLLAGDSAEPGIPASPADGWVTIRPARTPDLCLTDGRDRNGAYGSAVAVQLPCAQAPVPRTYLEPMGEGLYRIQWHHPQMGKGCLTVMSEDQIKGMLEPRRNCAQGTLFRLEPTAGTFRLRPATSSGCIGIVDNDTTVGAEAIEESCSGAADQRFLVRAG
ncbi:helix-turn-helix domain-containing protein [Streptomyces sp. NBC_00322]|uniref:helix-turn-helix transcriptional regulator n=1 Tax=Streptomyces sp. NBC_00322 TaxID=2975712 RepID=UPI002E2848ED|nr:helix-turn-helix transcriptional regulator [Streptomyces sp. NBC_00322]